ncbi:MAG: DUF1080 domain-containing protein [Pseudomonadota bacterium]
MGATRVACVARLSAALLAGTLGSASIADSSTEDWVELFNGKDLTGWTAKIRGYPAGENFADTFRVEDGSITVAYDGYEEFGNRFGHLFYREPFSHYRLRVEYRFYGEQAEGGESWATRNSGVMVHSQDPATMPPEQDFPISLEAQFLGGLDDGESRPTANLCTPGTHVEYRSEFTSTHCIESAAETFHGDQWVAVEVLVLGDDRLVHYVNGTSVIEYAHPTLGGGVVSGHRPEMKPEGEPLLGGFIALQSESHPIQFRRVSLLNLKGCTDPDARNFKTYFIQSDPESCRF